MKKTCAKEVLADDSSFAATSSKLSDIWSRNRHAISVVLKPEGMMALAAHILKILAMTAERKDCGLNKRTGSGTREARASLLDWHLGLDFLVSRS